MRRLRLLYIITTLIAVVAISTSCSGKLDDIAPKDEIPQGNLTEDDMTKLVNGIYADMEDLFEDFIYDWDIKGESYSGGPGFTLTDPISMTAADRDILSKWRSCFSTLNKVNFLLESYDLYSSSSSAAIKEAGGVGYLFRAYIYYTMVTRWGGVPILEKRSYDIIPISPEADVWEFIKADLKRAEALLPEFSDKFYLSKSALYMLSARVHLSLNDMSTAAQMAQRVIDNKSLSLTSTPEEFAANFVSTTSSKELVFALANKRSSSLIKLFQKVNDIDGTWEYSPAEKWHTTLFNDDGDRKDDIRAAATFASSDNSRTIKFANGANGQSQFISNDDANQSPLVIFRLSEAYLILAEALGNNSNGYAALQTLLNSRYDTSEITLSAMSDTEYQELILDERYREFYGEGYRWYDIKRTDRTDLFSSLEGRSYLMYYPIPQNEIDLAGSTAYPQNPGY